MRRRAFVSGAVTVAVSTLGGCLGGTTSSGNGTTDSGKNTTGSGKNAPTSEEPPTSKHLTKDLTETTNSAETSPPTDTETIQTTIDSPGYTRNRDVVGEGKNWSAKNHPQLTVTIGDRSRLHRDDMSHSILVWNDDTRTRTIRTGLIPINNQKRNGFRRNFRVKPDSYVVLKLARYQTYMVKVGVGENKAKNVAKITPDMIDCNISSTYVAARTDGSIDAVTSATSMLCGPPRTTSN